MESVLSLEIGDIQLALVDLKSLVGPTQPLTIPPINHRDKTISYPDIQLLEFWHKSFPDFLSDQTRSKEFYVPLDLAAASVAKGCLKLLSDNGSTFTK
jgi:hypothetical protein